MKHFIYKTDKKTGTKIIYQPSPDQGWVEILLDHLIGVYYYPSMPMPVFAKQKIAVSSSMQITDNQDVVEYLSTDAMNTGLKHTLAQVCLKEKKFIMPLFVSQDRITCGQTRFFALLVNGVEAIDIPIIVLSQSTPLYPGCQKINSTQHFLELFNLGHIDHEIGIHMNRDVPEVGHSLIQYTIYDQPKSFPFSHAITSAITSFWKKFQSEIGKRICVTISCTEHTKTLIKPCPWFDVSYVIKQPEEWQFSFGIILDSFRDASESPVKLHLYLFDIIEPVELFLLLAWPTKDYGTFISQNHKSVLLDTHNKSSFEIIGNWVK
jgi:hypothetical protein